MEIDTTLAVAGAGVLGTAVKVEVEVGVLVGTGTIAGGTAVVQIVVMIAGAVVGVVGVAGTAGGTAVGSNGAAVVVLAGGETAGWDVIEAADTDRVVVAVVDEN